MVTPELKDELLTAQIAFNEVLAKLYQEGADVSVITDTYRHASPGARNLWRVSVRVR